MKTHKLKVTLNEIKRMQELAGISNLNEFAEDSKDLRITKYKSNNGYKMIGLYIGNSLKDRTELLLSVDEAKELQKLAKKFSGQRNKVATNVNTKDSDRTQSTITIDPEDNGQLTIYRKEGSIYKNYDSQGKGGYYGGILEAPQSIVYTLVDELDKYTN